MATVLDHLQRRWPRPAGPDIRSGRGPLADFATHLSRPAIFKPLRPGASALLLRLGFVAMLAATIAALLFEDLLVERSRVLHPDPATASVRHWVDTGVGERSALGADRASARTCRLNRGTAFSFCGVELPFDVGSPGQGTDLSRVTRLEISYSYEGPGETLRLNLRNFDPRYSRPGDSATNKPNVVELRVAPGRATAELALADFAVAEWWPREYRVPNELARPDFSNIVALQWLPGTEAPPGRYHFAIHRIAVRERLLGREQFYLLLLALWAMVLGAFLLARMGAATGALRREVQARKKAEEHAQSLALHDSLTGFLNRHAFREQLAVTLPEARAAGTDGTVFLVEVGNLRSINDVYGAATGDELLVETARRLQSLRDGGAVIGRMGGNELALFVPGDAAKADSVAAGLTAGLNRAFVCNGNGLNPGATIGAVCFPEHGADYASLLRAADIALHEAKRAGGGSYRFYNPDLEGGASERIARIRGRERVLRASEERPAFIAHARTDLLLREGCRIAGAWPAGTMLCLALGAAEWQEDWTAERIVTQLDMNGLARSNLLVELAESVFLARAGATLRNLHALQAAGVNLGLIEFRGGFDPARASVRFDRIKAEPGFLAAGLSANEKKLFEGRG